MLTEREEKLIEKFNEARSEFKAKACDDSKAVHKYETIYGHAYQKLVKAGLKPKLRLKYRPLY